MIGSHRGNLLQLAVAGTKLIILLPNSTICTIDGTQLGHHYQVVQVDWVTGGLDLSDY